MSSLAPSLIEATRRAQQEIRSRPILIDLGVALLAMVLGLAEVFGTNIVATREPDALAVLLVCGGSLALVWRRSFPVAVLTIALAVLAVAYLRGYGSYLSAIGLIAVYSVAVYGSPRARAWIAVAVGIAALFWIASISIFDGGYMYGDGIYTTLRLYSGLPLDLIAHYERLQRHTAQLKIPFALPLAQLRVAIQELVVRNALTATEQVGHPHPKGCLLPAFPFAHDADTIRAGSSVADSS